MSSVLHDFHYLYYYVRMMWGFNITLRDTFYGFLRTGKKMEEIIPFFWFIVKLTDIARECNFFLHALWVGAYGNNIAFFFENVYCVYRFFLPSLPLTYTFIPFNSNWISLVLFLKKNREKVQRNFFVAFNGVLGEARFGKWARNDWIL